MGAIEEIYEDLDADVSEEEFREAVEAKVEQMGGLADEETAAMLIAHDLDGGEVETIADIEPGLEEVKFLGKVTGVGELRTFERDGEDDEGHVLNLDVADESGAVRVALWDEDAIAAEEEIAVGDVFRIKGRPKDGYNGTEVSADRLEPDDEATIDVDIGGRVTADSLSMGQSDVNLRGVVLDTGSIRTFDRDDGSEGRVSNLTLGDETGRVRVTLWDERADAATELAPGQSVEIVDGYVRERDGSLELHVGSRSEIDELDEAIEFVPDADDIADLEIDQTVDIAGVVRSADPKRTFDRDDGSEGQVRNVRIQDKTGDIRVALWGEKADADLGPGDEVFCADVEIQDGWQDDLEASAGWRSTIAVIDGAEPDRGADSAGLDEFADGSAPERSSSTESDDDRDSGDDEPETFTGTVVQPGEPVILDSGEETIHVETDADVHLGQEVTVRGRRDGDTFLADDVF
ncbi:MAG: single-stranded DNA binding protein [Natronomonas sp.]|jgi:replication factor A1|uniref:single-stranded DNA binding protein n=1 Tax=Natronomonas sp. TaxID=2184060 RepID=UPI002870626D|nr:single-stranded DNA binding protein [Natronomonas sp.]MDR9381894.1 single-stranded DNA binding protein [Natronomonas sp.]MDR9430094.1 single-stranded DNA binding protein [Natronomonas sp.]